MISYVMPAGSESVAAGDRHSVLQVEVRDLLAGLWFLAGWAAEPLADGTLLLAWQVACFGLMSLPTACPLFLSSVVFHLYAVPPAPHQLRPNNTTRKGGCKVMPRHAAEAVLPVRACHYVSFWLPARSIPRRREAAIADRHHRKHRFSP